MGREKAQAVKPARPNIQPEENRPRPLDDLKAIDRKLRFCVQTSFRLSLFRFQITLDAPDLTLPARSDFRRKLRRFFDGCFDASKWLFGLCFNIDRFCKEGQLLVGGFFFIQCQSKKFGCFFLSQQFCKVCTVP
jgi:hypothetical protein